MSNKIILLAFSFLSMSVAGKSQRLNLTGLEKLDAKEYFDEKIEKGNEILRDDKKVVIIQFHQDFGDTVLVYENDSLIMNKTVNPLENFVSTDYTGVSVTHRYISKKSIMTIIYKNQEKYLQFKMNKDFPLYAIYYLKQNDAYAISARKNKMQIE